MNKYFKYLLFAGVLVALSFLGFESVQADDYDIYVDADHDGDEKGDEDDPYKTIAKAISEADDDDEIYIEKGDYEEDLTIDKELQFFGDDLEDVIIEGEIEIKKNVEITKLTIDGNIIIKSGADVIFDNIVVENAPKTAIDAYEGNGEIVVKNSTIKHAGTKGFYIQKGRDVIITGCNVYKNEEEGLDLRINVDGTVSGNNIYENGESGIEFIVADSSLVIKNNSIKNNGSSGVAAQFYKDNEDEGEISIISNTATGNDKFGLDCNNPQGGNPDDDYWSNSINIDKNNFKSNNDGEIEGECKLSQPTQEAQEDQQEEERQAEIEEAEKEKEAQKLIEEQNRQKTIQENTYKLNKIVSSKKETKNDIQSEVDKIESRSGIVAFLIGPNYKSIDNIKEVASDFSEYLTQFDDLDRELIDSSNQNTAKTEMDDIISYAEEVNELIVEKDSKFSLFGWFFRLIS
jgi:parallel beta-helix repeat protein